MEKSKHYFEKMRKYFVNRNKSFPWGSFVLAKGKQRLPAINWLVFG